MTCFLDDMVANAIFIILNMFSTWWDVTGVRYWGIFLKQVLILLLDSVSLYLNSQKVYSLAPSASLTLTHTHFQTQTRSETEKTTAGGWYVMPILPILFSKCMFITFSKLLHSDENMNWMTENIWWHFITIFTFAWLIDDRMFTWFIDWLVGWLYFLLSCWNISVNNGIISGKKMQLLPPWCY